LEKLDQIFDPKKQDKQDKEKNKDASSNKPQHINITDDEKKLFDDIESKQKQWIQEMQDTKSDNLYNPENYLNELFKDFR
jgi:hypothetical protein